MINNKLISSAIIFVLNILLFADLYSQQNQALSDYVSFLKNVQQSPKEYILKLFENSDIVILCERSHPEFTQYEMIIDLINDNRFIQKIGHVFTEIGSSTNNNDLEQLMHGIFPNENNINEKLLKIYRNLDSVYLWENYNFYYFLQQLALVNSSLPNEKKVNIYFSGMPFDWSTMNKKKYNQFKKTLSKRDKEMADFIISKYDEILESSQTRKKALIIMNYRHAFNDSHYDDGRDRDNTGRYLYEKYKGKIANVLINSVALEKGLKAQDVIMHPIQDGKWDAAFEFVGNKDVGFDFENSPFGNDSFDFYPIRNQGTRYKDIFTGFVFYKPLKEHKLIYGIPGICKDGFADELWERFKIVGSTFEKKYKASLMRSRENIREFKYDNIDNFEATINKWL